MYNRSLSNRERKHLNIVVKEPVIILYSVTFDHDVAELCFQFAFVPLHRSFNGLEKLVKLLLVPLTLASLASSQAHLQGVSGFLKLFPLDPHLREILKEIQLRDL